jgi:hypothetical protein
LGEVVFGFVGVGAVDLALAAVVGVAGVVGVALGVLGPAVALVVAERALVVGPAAESLCEREWRLPTINPTAKAPTTRTTVVVTGTRDLRRPVLGGRACAMVQLVWPIRRWAMRAGATMTTTA